MIETSGVIEKEQGNGFYLVTLEQPEGPVSYTHLTLPTNREV